MSKIMESALQGALDAGAEYADVRYGEYRRQRIGARDRLLTTMQDSQESGIAVRVFYKGAWGCAAAKIDDVDQAGNLGKRAFEIAKVSSRLRIQPLKLAPVSAHQAQWKSTFEKDPFTVSIAEKSDLLFAINSEMASVPGISQTYSYMGFRKAHKLFISSVGSRIEQELLWSDASYNAAALGSGRFTDREFQSSPMQKGYEHVESMHLLAEAKRVAQEAVEKLTAKSSTLDRADLILLPSHTRLIIHETIGHATELDRIMGWEADYAGTSFATPEKLNNYRYGAPIFNVTADRTFPHGLATCAFDDDGVPSQKWPIIQNGILTGYTTTRDTAHFIGAPESRGCSFADNWSSMPILRMANIGIEPGPESAPTLDQLITDTEEGILMDGLGSFSIDHQRINFQFGSDLARRIHKGRIGEVLYNVTYEGSNPKFWSSVDAICRPSEWKPFGINGCAKGQPVQSASLTHGSAPLRLRNIKLRRNGQ